MRLSFGRLAAVATAAEVATSGAFVRGCSFGVKVASVGHLFTEGCALTSPAAFSSYRALFGPA